MSFFFLILFKKMKLSIFYLLALQTILFSCSDAFMFQPPKSKLEFWRKNIDIVDDKIYYLLSIRYQLVKKIKDEKTTVHDKKREKEIIERLKDKKKLSNDFIEKMWHVIFMQSYKIQLRD